jgi:hypothetical protein
MNASSRAEGCPCAGCRTAYYPLQSVYSSQSRVRAFREAAREVPRSQSCEASGCPGALLSAGISDLTARGKLSRRPLDGSLDIEDTCTARGAARGVCRCNTIAPTSSCAWTADLRVCPHFPARLLHSLPKAGLIAWDGSPHMGGNLVLRATLVQLTPEEASFAAGWSLSNYLPYMLPDIHLAYQDVASSLVTTGLGLRIA